MQTSCAIGISINMGQDQACLQLAADLLIDRVGKLHTAVRFFQLFPLIFVDQRIKGHGIDDLLFVLVHKIVYGVVQTAQEHTAVL